MMRAMAWTAAARCTEDTVRIASACSEPSLPAPCRPNLNIPQHRPADLQAPVCRYLPAFASNGKEAITVEHLMTHTAGLAAFYPFHAMRLRTRQAIVQFICDDEPRHPLGTTKYSDLSMIVLGEIVERLSGRPLDRYVAHAVFRPLGMHSTGACHAHGPGGGARGHPKHEARLLPAP